MSLEKRKDMLRRLSSPRYLNLRLSEKTIEILVAHHDNGVPGEAGIVGLAHLIRCTRKTNKPYNDMLMWFFEFVDLNPTEGRYPFEVIRVTSLSDIGIPISPFVNAFFPEGTDVPRMTLDDSPVEYFIAIERLLSATNGDLLQFFAKQWRYGFDNELFIYPKLPV